MTRVTLDLLNHDFFGARGPSHGSRRHYRILRRLERCVPGIPNFFFSEVFCLNPFSLPFFIDFLVAANVTELLVVFREFSSVVFRDSFG